MNKKRSHFKAIIYSIFLIFGGLVLSLVILEGSLRFAGFIYKFHQSVKNNADSGNDEFRIMILGESTSGPDMAIPEIWPVQLKDLLNNEKKLLRKFKIINISEPSMQTDKIFEFIEGKLNYYQPHMVISMIGINDREENGKVPFGGWNLIEKLRVTKFIS